MRILQHKCFAKWVKDQNITDDALTLAVNELVDGLFDANLGGSIYKKRISRKGHGKRGSYRTLIAFKKAERVIYILGFAKNERDSVSSQELVALK